MSISIPMSTRIGIDLHEGLAKALCSLKQYNFDHGICKFANGETYREILPSCKLSNTVQNDTYTIQ